MIITGTELFLVERRTDKPGIEYVDVNRTAVFGFVL
jgi:hypothetical protein